MFQLGRLECVQWLVRHSSLRDKLTSRRDYGERSLLHQAAKYGQVINLFGFAQNASRRSALQLLSIDGKKREMFGTTFRPLFAFARKFINWWLRHTP